MLAAGADIDAVDNESITALMLSTSENLSEMLIEKGANIDLVDKNGNTALFWAFSRGHYRVADRLIKDRPEIKEIEDFNRRLALRVMVSHIRNIQK